MDTKRLRELSLHQQALVAVAVLLDGIESGNYLESDANSGLILKEAADSLAGQRTDLRMTLAGTIFRMAIEKLA